MKSIHAIDILKLQGKHENLYKINIIHSTLSRVPWHSLLNCYTILGFCDDNKSYEVNRRAVLPSVTIGNGLSALKSFCADLNMPTPMSQNTFESHLSAVKLATEETAKHSLSQTTKELHEHLETPLNEVVDCRTMFDGR